MTEELELAIRMYICYPSRGPWVLWEKKKLNVFITVLYSNFFACCLKLYINHIYIKKIILYIIYLYYKEILCQYIIHIYIYIICLYILFIYIIKNHLVSLKIICIFYFLLLIDLESSTSLVAAWIPCISLCFHNFHSYKSSLSKLIYISYESTC